MLRAVEKLTNKAKWWLKCRDEEIAERWRKEMLEMDWEKLLGSLYADFTPLMADAVIAELRKKATFYELSGLVPIMDASAAAIKSDTILTEELAQALKKAVARLESVPEEQKDWHPGSNNQVLDLVHPSLWPLVYALSYSGTGAVIPKPSQLERLTKGQSNSFQWLPCDVGISSDGKATIESYINNLHPVHHADLYPIIEKLIEKSLPAWDMVYSWPSKLECQRLQTMDACFECTADGADEETGEVILTPRRLKDMEWFKQTHKVDMPEPDPTGTPLQFDSSDYLTSGFFDGAQRIQVIVKLANIHLTPENPSYEGGSWHVEGMLNEHICATALYYYDSDNISDSHLSFRTRSNAEELNADLEYEQSQWQGIERLFAIKARDGGGSLSTVQELGRVLTRSGRALFFPNVYQHRVSPFKLEDPTRPGHRKILALFLVDPAIPVISTANVGPQQRHWWAEDEALTSKLLSKLPVELRGMVTDEVRQLMDLEEAKRVRLELMKERTTGQKDLNQAIEGDDFNFCEH
ncbi:hypothetical protein NLU13_2612 [Sarocladium strictum]|uniref:DUF4246 domain-containing protein n=1 Tax=Sarocladium strictum TaxID=5046 RepID=A0AA39GL70_SARSR|nr:hypothetical protein NLU13_2612 [Sarocladium strictum]